MISQVKDRYPNVYKVLIEERNNVMIKNLRKLAQKYPEKKILAVMGAGHKEEVERRIKNIDIVHNIKFKLPKGMEIMF